MNHEVLATSEQKSNSICIEYLASSSVIVRGGLMRITQPASGPSR